METTKAICKKDTDEKHSKMVFRVTANVLTLHGTWRIRQICVIVEIL